MRTLKEVRLYVANRLGYRSYRNLINSFKGDKELIDWYNDATNTEYQLQNRSQLVTQQDGNNA